MRGTARDWAIWSTFACAAFLCVKLVYIADARTIPSLPSNRELSIADANRPGRYDDDSVLGTTDDDVSSAKSSDVTKSANSSMRVSSSVGTRSSSSSTSASTASSSSSSSNSSPAPTRAPRKHNAKSSSSSTSSSNHITTSTDLGNTTSSGKDEAEETTSYSEWTFHNETAAADDAKHSLSVANATNFLPPEKEQTDSWTFAVLAIFTILAVVLLSVTAYRNYRDHPRRNSYEEIANIVV